MASLRLFRFLAAAWMGLIFMMSSRPDMPAPELFWQQDKLAHAFVFGILGFLLAYSLKPPGVTTWTRVILLTALVMIYGMADEYHQSFVPGRDASSWDVLADGVGGFLAALMLFWWNHGTVEISGHASSGGKERA